MSDRFDWHDSSCGGMETTGFDGQPITLPCDCGMPEMFRSAYESGRDDERQRIRASIRVSRSSSPIWAHVDAFGLGQVLKGETWPDDR